MSYVFSVSYSTRSFEIKGESSEDGSISLTLPDIAPGGSGSVNVTVAPKHYGIYESTRARLRYYSVESEVDEETDLAEEDQFSGFSSAMPRVRILSKEEHLRVSSGYLKDWAGFAFFTLFTIGAPFAIWQNKKAVTQGLARKKK
jgi:hypothetical protein